MAHNPLFGSNFISKSVVTQCKTCLAITPTPTSIVISLETLCAYTRKDTVCSCNDRWISFGCHACQVDYGILIAVQCCKVWKPPIGHHWNQECVYLTLDCMPNLTHCLEQNPSTVIENYWSYHQCMWIMTFPGSECISMLRYPRIYM